MTAISQVVVESGHMVDASDRATPRFPADAERRIAAAVDAVLAAWTVGPSTVVLSQGACGTDIIVAERALDRGADVRLRLALAPDAFEAISVAPAGPGWSGRFRALLARCDVAVQPDESDASSSADNPFERNNRWVLEEGYELATGSGAPLRGLVVSDGADREGAGGTADFLGMAESLGVDVTVLDPRAAWEHPNVPYWERQPAGDRKRLLSLDGGGLRGMITLQILKRIEELLGAGDTSFVLADYFDYIAGTSTGAIIAAGLSLGKRVAEIDQMYRVMGPHVFRRGHLGTHLRSLYKEEDINRELQSFVGAETTLGADELRTLLLVVLHRVDTDSIWPVSNNTAALYNDRASHPGDTNLDLPLWQLIRGSAAAPIYFQPERIQIGTKEATFEDGGMTPFNNPSPLLYEMATSPRYRLGWASGAERLLLVSVGTGFAAVAPDDEQGMEVNLGYQVKHLVKVIMSGSSTENDRLCRVLGACRHGDAIDSEFDADDVAGAAPAAPLFSYVRYNADISAKGLGSAGLDAIDPNVVARLDAVGALDDLAAIGTQAAARVASEHFVGFETA